MLLRRQGFRQVSFMVYGLLCVCCLLRTHSWLLALLLITVNYIYLGFLIMNNATTAILTCVLSTILVFALLLLIYRMSNSVLKSFVDVPIVPDDSWFGNISMLEGKKSHEKILYWTRVLGPIYQFICYGRSIVVVSDPALAKHVLRNVLNKGDLNLAKGGYLKNMMTLNAQDTWKSRRNTLAHGYSASALFSHANEMIILSKVSEFCDTLLVYTNKGHTVDIDRYFGRMSVSILCKVIYNFDVKENESYYDIATLNEDIKRFSQLMNGEGDPVLSHYTRWWPSKQKQERNTLETKLKSFCKMIMYHIVAIKQEGRSPANAHTASMAYANLFEHENMSEDDMLSEILYTLLAGYEKVAHSLSWLIYMVCKHSHIQSEIQQNIPNYWREEHESVNISIKYPTEYIECVIKESMRKYTVASQSALRLVIQDSGFQLGPHLIPKGSWLYVSLYAIHNSELNWGSDAKEVRPERFLDKPCSYSTGCTGSNQHGAVLSGESPTTAYSVGDVNDMIFAPFSFGARGCIGMNIALMIIRLSAVQMLAKFSFAFSPATMMQVEDYAMESVGTLTPRDGLPVLVSKRSD